MISQTAEYALRASLFLAARADSGPASAVEVAEATRVSVLYLQKILRKLARHGILTVSRGNGGGFALARAPTSVSVLDILRASDMHIPRIEECPLGIKGHQGLCCLHRLLDADMARSEEMYATTTIADLLNCERGVRPLCAPSRGHH